VENGSEGQNPSKIALGVCKLCPTWRVASTKRRDKKPLSPRKGKEKENVIDNGFSKNPKRIERNERLFVDAKKVKGAQTEDILD